MSEVFDPSQFFARGENVALNVSANELFDTFTRSLALPAQWAALVTQDQGDRLVIRSGGVISRDDAKTVLLVRSSPVEVELVEDGLASGDGFVFSAAVRLPVSVVAEAGDLVSFQGRIVGGRRVVQVLHLVEFFQQAVRSALSRCLGAHEAIELSGAVGSDAAADAIVGALQEPCFLSGLSLYGKPGIRLTSRGYADAVRVREAAATRRVEHEATRQIEEALARARREKLDELASDIDRLKALARRTPEADVPKLLQAFSQRQRGALYEALFSSETASPATRWLVVAAGDEVLFVDARRPQKAPRKVPVAGQAGPVRSIHARNTASGDPVLWLGAAAGVYRLPLDAAAPDLILKADAPIPVRGGFNSVAVSGDRVFATHSELGLYEWDAGHPESGRSRFVERTREATAVRCAMIEGSHVYLSIDDGAVRFSLDEADDRMDEEYRGSDSTITAMHVNATALYAGNSGGDLLSWPLGSGGAPECLHRGQSRAVESIWLVETGGVRRLVYTDTSPRVHARVLGDSFTCHYEAGGQTLRRVEVADDLIVATSDIRDRLFIWNAGEPGHPRSVISIASLTGHSVQDVCLV